MNELKRTYLVTAKIKRQEEEKKNTRDHIITQDEILNLKIALNLAKDVNEFLGDIFYMEKK